MDFRFIHTADWQIGKPFGEFAGDKPGVLRQARLTAVDRVAEVARAQGAQHVLVAGDVFDFETGSAGVVRKLMAKLASHRALTWHLISGNHDPARPSSVWDEMRAAPPNNVQLHLDAVPAEIARGVVLLPAPLTAKASASDPTAWMDDAVTAEGTIRIGLAHGSITGFGSEGDAAVPIDPLRAKRAELAYLALGDWHGTRKISDRVWYSGTPEPDCFPDNEPGHVLAVHLESSGAVPRVERIRTADYTWMKRSLAVADAADLAPLAAEVAALGPDAQHHLLALELRGRMSLGGHLEIAKRLTELEASLFHLGADLKRLTIAHDATDLAVFGHGALRTVAERLSGQAANDSDERQARIAAQALLKLAAIANTTSEDNTA